MSTPSDTAPKATGYLLLFRNPSWAENYGESEVREAMERVSAWLGRLSTEGRLVASQPLLEPRAFISGKGGSTVIDGPFTEAKEVIGGFVQISAASMEEAVAIAKGNPMHDYGVTTEVRVTGDACAHVHRALNRLAEVGA